MSDEFPTLEVALAAGVAVLLWRGWLLRRTRLGLLPASERLFETFRNGTPNAHTFSAAKLGPLLEPLALAAVTAPGKDLPQAVKERSARLRQRERGAAARDLVICGVLGGSLLYASSSELARGWVFFALGGAAVLLLLLAVLERLLLERELVRIAGRFGTSLAEGPGEKPKDAPPREVTVCGVCGGQGLERWTDPAELGPKLWALGVRELFVCRLCGHASDGRPEASKH